MILFNRSAFTITDRSHRRAALRSLRRSQDRQQDDPHDRHVSEDVRHRNASAFRMTRAAIAVTTRAMKSGAGHSRMRNGIVVPPRASAHISALEK
jgi:hypothetical protein